MNSIQIETKLVTKILNKFLDEDINLESENDDLLIIGKVKKIVKISYTVALKIVKIKNPKVYMNLDIKYVKVAAIFNIKNMLIEHFQDLINQKINAKYPGIAKLNYPELLLDLSAIKVKEQISLTNLITVRNITLGNEIVIELE